MTVVPIEIGRRYAIERRNGKGDIDLSLPVLRERAIARDTDSGALVVVTLPAGADGPVQGEVHFTMEDAVRRARRVMAGSAHAFTHPQSITLLAAALLALTEAQ